MVELFCTNLRDMHKGYAVLVIYKLGLRRSAANDNIFKLFFLHPFLASTIYNNTIKNKFNIG